MRSKEVPQDQAAKDMKKRKEGASEGVHQR